MFEAEQFGSVPQGNFPRFFFFFSFHKLFSPFILIFPLGRFGPGLVEGACQPGMVLPRSYT